MSAGIGLKVDDGPWQSVRSIVGRRLRKHWKIGCVGHLLALLLVLWSDPRAYAHAVLLEHSPTDSSPLLAPRGEVRLRFDEAVSPVVIRVLDAFGRSLTVDADVSVVDTTITVRLPKALPEGSYIVSYRVISADSHPVGGSFVFSVGAPTTASASVNPATASSDDPPWAVVAATLRTLFYGAFLFATGGSLFLVFVDRRSPAADADRRQILAACFFTALLLALSLGVEGASAAGAPLVALLDPAVWRLGAGTTIGESAGLSTLGVAVLVFGLRRNAGPAASIVMLTGTVVAATGFGVTGHVATTDPRWLTAPALVLHVLCDAFWIGALVPLYRRLGTDTSSVVAPVVARFSRQALYVVPVLFASGLLIACVQVRTPAALLETDYGRLFVIKLTLVAILLAVAALNKLRLTPALQQGAPNSARRLRLSVVAEIALIVGILLATSLLGEKTPPRALQAQVSAHHHQEAASTFTVTVGSGNHRLLLEVTPLHSGDSDLTMTFTNEDGTPMAPLEVAVQLSSPSLGVEPSDYKGAKTGPGRYAAKVPFPVAGTWTVEIDALVTDFESAAFSTTVVIK